MLYISKPISSSSSQYHPFHNSHYSQESSSNSVIQKLSTTRQLLEHTLNRKRRTNLSIEEPVQQSLHHELSSPTFSHLNNIYSSYHKAPTDSKMNQKFSSPKRKPQSEPVFLKTKDKLKQENEIKFKEECTFKPKINQSSREESTSREDLFEKLAKSKAEVVLEREKVKRQLEDMDRDRLSSRTKSISGDSRVEDRLYTKENKALKYEMIKRQQEEKEASSFPYSPQISSSTSKFHSPSKPLYLRIKQVQDERALKKQQASECIEPVYSFHPSISPNSHYLAKNRSKASQSSRLTHSSISKAQSINSSISIHTQPSNLSTAQDFLDRQQSHQAKSEKEKALLFSASAENLKFKPTISENSKIILNCKRNLAGESFREKIDRIVKGDTERNRKLKNKLEKEVYGKYKFTPDINEISKVLVKNSSFVVDDLKNKKKLRAQASVAEIEKTCSFSPCLNNNKRFDRVRSVYTQNEEILNGIEKKRKEKNLNAKMVKDELEVKEREKCTFKPKRIPRISSDGDVKVKGVDRFYELRNLALRQKEEKEIREKKVLYKDSIRDMLYSPN